MTDIWIRLRALWLLLPFALAYYSGWPIFFWLVAFIGGIWEIEKRRPINFWSIVLSFQLLGLLILTVSFSAQIAFFLVIVVGFNDGAACIGGKHLNFWVFRKKIFPVTSPNKTWGGLFYGLIFAILAGIIFNKISPLPFGYVWVYSIAIALFAVLGDFLKSKFKRSHKIKDSGEGLFTERMLSGHGGICDRFDAISMAGWGWFFIRGFLFLL